MCCRTIVLDPVQLEDANRDGKMKNAHKRWGLGVSLLLLAGTALASVTPSAANAASQPPRACGLPSRSGHIAGIVPALGGKCLTKSAHQATSNTKAHNTSDPASGTPPTP